MKLQFKHQPFQAEAAAAVCDVFNGQPYRTVTYRRDLGDTAGSNSPWKTAKWASATSRSFLK